MPLLDLLTTNAFELGVTTDSRGNPLPLIPGVPPNGGVSVYPNVKNPSQNQVPHSKGIINNKLAPQSFTSYHLSRLNPWDTLDSEQNPLFTNYGNQSHDNGGIVDGGRRGGAQTFDSRVEIDASRISLFLSSPQGQQFVDRQNILQLLNPRPETRNWSRASLELSVSDRDVRYKRHGLIPEIAGLPSVNALIGGAIDNALGDSALGSAVGDLVGNIFGNDYLGKIGTENREFKFGLGYPGQPQGQSFLDQAVDLLVGSSRPLEYDVNVKLNDDGYYSPIEQTNLDHLNYLDIVEVNNENPLDDNIKSKIDADFVPFNFEIIDPLKPEGSYNIIAFRAFLDSMNDTFNAEHNDIKYNGRAESFYTYKQFKRTISFDFKVAAQTRHEMRPLYRKINYLAAQTAPHYSPQGNRIMTPYARLTIGDYFSKLPGVITSVAISWKTDYPWEIRLDRSEGGKDSDVLILPHLLDVNVNYLPIHSFTPRNKFDLPFIGLNSLNSSAKSFLEKPLINNTSDYN